MKEDFAAVVFLFWQVCWPCRRRDRDAAAFLIFITNWEWSGGHIGETVVDAVALIPGIGVIKNIAKGAAVVDGIADGAKAAKKIEKAADAAKDTEKITDITKKAENTTKDIKKLIHDCSPREIAEMTSKELKERVPKDWEIQEHN